MASHANPFLPNPSLIAVLLVIKSGTGPRCVLQYPPEPLHDTRHGRGKRQIQGTEASSDETSDFAAWSDGSGANLDEADEVQGAGQRRHGRRRGSTERSRQRERVRSNLRHEVNASSLRGRAGQPETSSVKANGARSGGEHSRLDEQEARAPVNKSLVEKSHETFLGYSTDSLAKLLSPKGRKWHKRRLEVTLGDYCFVGCPMFCREDGGWEKPPRKKRQRKKSTRASTVSHRTVKGEEDEAGDERDDTTTTEREEESASEDGNAQTQPPETVNAKGDKELPISSLSSTPSSADLNRIGEKGQPQNALQMFNVAFVLCPPAVEHQMRVRELYVNVVKTLAAALRHQQRREAYVWNEAKAVHAAREKAIEKGQSSVEAWASIAAESSLARALAITYDHISTSHIAHISLGPSLDLSLQIPQALSTAHAPTPQNPQIPGMWLTSADLTLSHDGTYGTTVSPQGALLLLVPAETLTQELTASTSSQVGQTSDFAGPLAYFIRRCNPTKTLSQLSKKLRLSLPDLQFLSLHLIRWRRARAITPLHPSNIYIPSPNADMSELPYAREHFRRRFTAAPDLVAVLAKLGDNKSNAPRPWSAMIPSTDHKGMYMEVLAWLVRGGWVCQIRTFAWVVITPDVKRAVEKLMRKEEREAREALTAASLHESPEEEPVTEDHGVDLEMEGSTTTTKRRMSNESGLANTQALFSPRMRATLFPPKPSSVTGSVSSGQTAVRISNAPLSDAGSHLKELGGSKEHSRQPSNETAADEDAEIDQKEYETSLVLSPHKANSLESKWLEHVGKCLPDEDLRQAWPTLVKYFDGQHAIEEIAIREDKKRKAINPLLIRLMGQGGVLRIVRHW